MVTINVKVMSVNELTTEKGGTVTVNFGLVNSLNAPNAPVMGGASVDITGQEDQIAFYKANAGSVIQLPIDITTVTVITPQPL